MKFEEIEGKAVAMVVHNAEKEDDVHVYLGEFNKLDNEYFFINKDRGWQVSLNEEQMGRLKPVPEQLKSILLNACYFFPMILKSLNDL